MEYHNGGELYYHMKNKDVFTEKEAKFYISQVVLAIEFLHSKKIIYRDLKPENIILDKYGYIKLTDFGLAKDEIHSDTVAQTLCGTSDYLAPEIVKGEKYGKSVDVWCIGILLYEMLFGIVKIFLNNLILLNKPPFYNENKNFSYQMILNGKPDYNLYNIKISKEAIDLFEKILNKNPKKRLKINQVKKHKFFEEINFDKLLNHQIKAPFVPDIVRKLLIFLPYFRMGPTIISTSIRL